MVRDPITGARISTPTYYKVGSDFFTGVNQKVSDQNTLASLQSGKTPFSTVQSGLEGQFTDPQFFDKIKKGEPAILSSSAGRSAFDKNIAPKIQQANQNAQMVQQNNQSKSDTSSSIDVASMLASEGENPEDVFNRKILENYDKQRESAEKNFNTLTVLQNNSAQMQRNSLTNSYNQRRNELEKANDRYMRDAQTSMIRSGVSRYAPQSANNFLSAKEQEHIQTLTDLDNEYNAKLGEINSAVEAKSISLAAQLTQDLNQIDEKVLKVVQEQVKEAAKATKEIRDRNIQIERDLALSQVLSQGFTDKKEILQGLNEAGMNITAKELDEGIKSLTGAENEIKGSVDLQDYFTLRDQGMIPDFIAGLPQSEQFGAYTSWRKGIEKGTITPQGTPVSNVKKVAPITDLTQIDSLPVSTLTKSIMAGYGKLKDLTPTDKASVLEEMYQVGFQPQTYVMQKLNNLVSLYAKVPENFKGVIEGFVQPFASNRNANVAEFESAKEVLTREIARLNDVGMLSDQDVASYKNSMPSRMDSGLGIVLSKISGLGSTIAGKKAQNVGKTGVLEDGRPFIVSFDGETLLDPTTGEPIENEAQRTE